MTLKDLVLKGSTTKIEDISRFQVLITPIYNDRVGAPIGPVIVSRSCEVTKTPANFAVAVICWDQMLLRVVHTWRTLAPLYLFRAQVFFCFAGEVWLGCYHLEDHPWLVSG